MADAEEDSDHVENRCEKRVKRVRFSEEIELVELFAESDDSGSHSLDSENQNVFIAPVEIHNDGVNIDSFSNASMSSSDFIELDDCNNNELCESPQNVTVEFPSSPVKNDTREDKSVESSSCSTTVKISEIDPSQESPELMDLITETKSMCISPTKHAKSVPDPFVLKKEHPPPISIEETEKNEIEDEGMKKTYKTSLSRKRSLEGVILQRQTTKLNSCLKNKSSELNSAGKLKDAVFNAWVEVKNEKNEAKSSVSNISSVPPALEKNDTENKESASNRAYEMWKKTKVKSKKQSNKATESARGSSQKSKSKQDLEESKMAFKAWKKRKDENLKYHLVEKYKKEDKEKTESLISERTKKSEADSAFTAWRAHKSYTLKLEKKKKQWLLEREKEKVLLKMKRNDEAVKVYQDWLENKMYSENSNNHQMLEDKPPWIPPGKGSSFM